ncbi:DUF58 domain-containing protein [Amycolatopsis sp. YIM 10]|uniref:DUF58 domain-containing protein n=1 Tax=Amycolatopsis sp. YIM 10 TaxID=2653857 RepID=UPI0012903A5A|nr:DUF58 domain-containing protein [Amycolatopsis sp. YIM 10]QFU93247.1 hypothetical protein YIM_40550 [Amycolatopsis sp. YIM 10]
MRLTRRGVAVLVLAVVLLGAGIWAGHPMLRALGGICAGAVLVAVSLVGRSPKVAVSRAVYPDRVERGRPALARLLVRNEGTRRQAGFTAGDRVGSGVRAVGVRALAPGAEAVYHYELPTEQRGKFEVGPLVLERSDPLGLARNRLASGDPVTLWVHPRRHPVRAISGGQPRHHHEGRAADDALHGSLDLREVREYVPGDEIRHLHWKATARTGSLMVREFADPDQPRLTLLLDTRAERGFEDAVEVAASMLNAAALAGHRCRLVTPAGLDVSASDGPQGARRLLDELCVAEAEPAQISLVPPALSLSRSRGGALVVVATGESDVAALARLRPFYPVFTVFSLGGRMDSVPGARLLEGPSATGLLQRWNAVVK